MGPGEGLQEGAGHGGVQGRTAGLWGRLQGGPLLSRPLGLFCSHTLALGQGLSRTLGLRDRGDDDDGGGNGRGGV